MLNDYSSMAAWGTQTPLGFGSQYGAAPNPMFAMPGADALGFGSEVNPATLGTSISTSGVPSSMGTPADTPDVAKTGGLWGEGGFSLDKVGTIIDGLGSLGSLWSGIQANKMAAEGLAFQKKSYKQNYTNQLKSYNTALEDRTRARFAQEGRSAAEEHAYVRKNKLR